MRTGRPKQPLNLTEEEQERLESLAHRARTQAALARRARVVLACAEGLDNKSVAKKLRCSLGMVGKWRSRFLKTRLEGLYDEPRPGAPRKVSDDQVEQVLIQTLESTPGAAWTSPIGSPMRARSRDATRKRRSFGGRQSRTPPLLRSPRASVRLAKYYVKRPRSTLAAPDCLSARCRASQPPFARHPRPSLGKRSGGTSHVLAGAERSSRNAVATDCRAAFRVIPVTLARILPLSELNLRKLGCEEEENRGRLQ
jgi:hypothetical protein